MGIEIKIDFTNLGIGRLVEDGATEKNKMLDPIIKGGSHNMRIHNHIVSQGFGNTPANEPRNTTDEYFFFFIINVLSLNSPYPDHRYDFEGSLRIWR